MHNAFLLSIVLCYSEAPGADCPVALNWMIHNKCLDIPRDTFWYIIHYINHFVKLINEFVIKSAQQCWQIAYKQPQLRHCDTTMASGSLWPVSRPAEVNWILLIAHSFRCTVYWALALTMSLFIDIVKHGFAFFKPYL